ncbi:phosphoribosylanthranilate isomerase [Bacillus dakarensis]|uniref:phosphoribosylanthranilate isomerase n=1 Tax=Robertmurraya dakarensis TaxID=1926278 RepID=UPI0009813596|nr:phosphoribosylanthranilate isomerase [Bacillus dakarensis]
MKVKICGIKDVETALYAISQGADALGFLFAESKRRITPEDAKEIIDKLPDKILKVGVFVNEEVENIKRIVEYTGLTAVQLHGDEPPETCEAFSIPVIKALSVGSSDDLEKIHEYDCEYVLLDSPKGKYRGGNGVKFDWSLLAEFNTNGKKVILAGGLNEANVTEAIRMSQPFMVDVSSGVETDGKKDKLKIHNFIDEAKSAQREEVK